MSTDSWEERMSARAHARGAAGERLSDGRHPSDVPDPHEGHVKHMHMNQERCSCGELLGVSCAVFPKDPDVLVEVACPDCDDTILVYPGSTPEDGDGHG